MTVQIISQKWDPKLQVDVVNYVGLSTDVKPTILTSGSTFHESDTGNDFISGALGWTAKPAAGSQAVAVVTLPGTSQADIAAMKGKIDTMQADTALIKAQNQTAKLASHSLVFDEDDLVKTAAIAYNGLVKHLHLIVPNFTNVITAMVTLVDASGRILWTSAAKAKNASYNLEGELEWIDQLADNTLVWTVTLSGAAGGTGGTITLVSRYYGV